MEVIMKKVVELEMRMQGDLERKIKWEEKMNGKRWKRKDTPMQQKVGEAMRWKTAERS